MATPAQMAAAMNTTKNTALELELESILGAVTVSMVPFCAPCCTFSLLHLTLLVQDNFSTSSGEQEARGDGHGLDLVEEQLGRVGNPHLGKVRQVLAGRARVDVLVGVDRRDHAALLADEDAVVVRALHEALLEEVHDAVRKVALDLHLAEAQAAVPGAALGRLARQQDDGAVVGAAAGTRIKNTIKNKVRQAQGLPRTTWTDACHMYTTHLWICGGPSASDVL